MEAAPQQKLGASKQFLFDTYQFSIDNTIKSVTFSEDPKTKSQMATLILQSTIYHAQGGGQPADKGYFIFQEHPDAKIQIESASIDKETEELIHVIKKPDFELKIGDKVKLEIDPEWRKLNARNHSSGHLIDQVMREQESTWGAGKGYHFPDAPYVEYILPGAVDASKLDALKDILNKACNDLIQNLADEDKVITKVVDFDEASKVVKVPEFLKGKELRLVKLDEKDWWGLCGGTHVQHLKEIGKLVITKLQKKGKRVRVQYNVA